MVKYRLFWTVKNIIDFCFPETVISAIYEKNENRYFCRIVIYSNGLEISSSVFPIMYYWIPKDAIHINFIEDNTNNNMEEIRLKIIGTLEYLDQ